MDALVMALAGLTVGIRAPRAGLDPKTRLLLEKACDGSERIFAVLRDAVRKCDAFQRLPIEEQQRIEQLAMTAPAAPLAEE